MVQWTSKENSKTLKKYSHDGIFFRDQEFSKEEALCGAPSGDDSGHCDESGKRIVDWFGLVS